MRKYPEWLKENKQLSQGHNIVGVGGLLCLQLKTQEINKEKINEKNNEGCLWWFSTTL